MTSTTPQPWAEGPPALDVILSCAVLFVLAVTQPLLDLLGRNAEFFLARATPTVDIVLLALLLTFGIPVFGTLIGAFLGSVAGVWLVELWIKRDWQAARRAVRAYIGGSILSTILEVTLTLVMVGLFIWRVVA